MSNLILERIEISDLQLLFGFERLNTVRNSLVLTLSELSNEFVGDLIYK